MHVADLLGGPSSDRVTPAHQLVGVVGMEALHAAGGRSADTAGLGQPVKRVPAGTVVGVGRVQRPGEIGIVLHALAQFLHDSRRFESSDGL